MNKEVGSSVKVVLVIKAFDSLGEFARFGAICFCSYMAFLSVDALSGQQTSAKIELILDFFTKDTKSLLPWLLSAICFVWALWERRLRNKKVESMHDHSQKLEMLLDRNRTSSNLTKRGLTNPEDKI